MAGMYIIGTKGKGSLAIFQMIWQKRFLFKGTFLNSGSLMPTKWLRGKTIGKRTPRFIDYSVDTCSTLLSSIHCTCQVRRKMSPLKSLETSETLSDISWYRPRGRFFYLLTYLPLLYSSFLLIHRSSQVVWFSFPEEFLLAFLIVQVCWLWILLVFVCVKVSSCLPSLMKDSFSTYRIFGWKTFPSLLLCDKYVIPVSSGFHSCWWCTS